MQQQTKPERLAAEWTMTHPESTLEEAFVAGYIRHIKAWLNQEK